MGRGHVAGNHTSCTQGSSMGRGIEVGTSRLTGNHIFWAIRVLKADREVGKDGTLLPWNVTCCLLRSHSNKISLADKKHPSFTDAMTLLI